MSTYLLDVNVLIALIDPLHVHHDRAHRWFTRTGKRSWLSSPTTQNGCVRIVSNPRYPNPAPPAAAAISLASLLGVGSHRFVSDRISVLDSTHIAIDQVLSGGQVTDTYLLALAAAERARLATFDTKISVSAVVRREPDSVYQIG